MAGIIVCAVADEIVLMHPGHATPAGLVVIFGGPLLYLLGNALFKWVTNDRRLPPLSHLVGIVLLGVVTYAAVSLHASALMSSTLTTGVMIAVAAWESLAVRRARA